MITEEMQSWGTISRTHGVKGQVIIDLQQTLINKAEEVELVFLQLEGLPVPFFFDPENTKLRNSKQLMARLDGIGTLEEATKLIGTDVYIPRRFVADHATENVRHNLYDYNLHDSSGTNIGRVIDFIDNPGNPLLEITKTDGKIALIPYVTDWILEVNQAQKIISMQMPDGLLDL